MYWIEQQSYYVRTHLHPQFFWIFPSLSVNLIQISIHLLSRSPGPSNHRLRRPSVFQRWPSSSYSGVSCGWIRWIGKRDMKTCSETTRSHINSWYLLGFILNTKKPHHHRQVPGERITGCSSKSSRSSYDAHKLTALISMDEIVQ